MPPPYFGGSSFRTMYVLRTSTSSQKKLGEITSQAVDYSPHASSTCCRPSLSVTELPPEIWHRVFDFLFYIPGAFSIDEEENDNSRGLRAEEEG